MSIKFDNLFNASRHKFYRFFGFYNEFVFLWFSSSTKPNGKILVADRFRTENMQEETEGTHGGKGGVFKICNELGDIFICCCFVNLLKVS